MENNILKATIDLLIKIDNHLLNEKEIIEEYENAKDFEEVLEKFYELITNFRNINTLEEKEITENLIHLHLVYSDLIWHHEQVHELIKKVIKNR